MIDIHCHIIPGVDDGARTINDSIEMAKLAVDQGIHTIVATPHHLNNQFENLRKDIIAQVKELNRVLKLENIPLNILPGQEVRIHGDLIQGLAFEEILTVNYDTPYILIELPTASVPKYTNKLLYDLQVEGFTPIIVHPERNTELLAKPDKLYEMVKSGALTQVTAASILGKFGKKIRKFSHEIIQCNLTHFIATDAHNVHNRGFLMQDALLEIESAYGTDLVYSYQENAKLLVSGDMIIGDIPEKILRKKFLGVF